MPQVTLSRSTINKGILAFEVSWSPASGFETYNKKYSRPIVPAPQTTSSGVTFALGYDCGFNSAQTIIRDWSSVLPMSDVLALSKCAGLKKWDAVKALPSVKNIVVPIDAALQVFYNTTLYKFAKQAVDIYPDLPKLHPVEQTVFVGLVYNRGNDISNIDRRLEMRQLISAIKRDNDNEMAGIVRHMKRLWKDTKGLQIRRDVEADLILLADNPLPTSDVFTIAV